MKDFKVIYKKKNPIIGFTATSSGMTPISAKINGPVIDIRVGPDEKNVFFFLDKEDAQSFIDNLQDLVNKLPNPE